MGSVRLWRERLPGRMSGALMVLPAIIKLQSPQCDDNQVTCHRTVALCYNVCLFSFGA